MSEKYGRPLRIIDHVLQLNGARFVHLDPAPVPIDAKTRSAFRLVGIDATGCLAPDLSLSQIQSAGG